MKNLGFLFAKIIQSHALLIVILYAFDYGTLVTVYFFIVQQKRKNFQWLLIFATIISGILTFRNNPPSHFYPIELYNFSH